MPWINLEDLSVELFGLRQFASAVMPYGSG